MLRRVVAVFLVFASFVGSARAREADLDSRFSGDGRFVLSLNAAGGNQSDVSVRLIPDINGDYVLIGFSDPGIISFQRVFADGAIDLSFGRPSHSTPLVAARASTVDAAGRIIVVGATHKSGGAVFDYDPVVCRYLSDGSIDTSLGATGCKTFPIDIMSGGLDVATAVAVDAANEIYVAGYAQFSNADFDFLVMKLSGPTATPVAGFGNNGVKTIGFDLDTTHSGGDDDEATAIALDAGSLYVGGFAMFQGARNMAITKLHANDGSFDTTFCPAAGCSGSAHNGKFSFGYDLGGTNNDEIRALAIMPICNFSFVSQADKLASGTAYVSYVVATMSPDGAEQQTGYGASHAQTILTDLDLGSMTVRSDNKIVVAGTTAGAPGQTDPQRYIWVAQTTPTGAPDNTFSDGLFGGTSPFTILSFPAKDTSQPVDHRVAQLLLDRGRILLAGAYLNERNVMANIDDFNFAVARLQGDSIFTDGFQR